MLPQAVPDAAEIPHRGPETTFSQRSGGALLVPREDGLPAHSVHQVRRRLVGSSAASRLLPAAGRRSPGPRPPRLTPSLLRPRMQPVCDVRVPSPGSGVPGRRPGGAKEERAAAAAASASPFSASSSSCETSHHRSRNEPRRTL